MLPPTLRLTIRERSIFEGLEPNQGLRGKKRSTEGTGVWGGLPLDLDSPRSCLVASGLKGSTESLSFDVNDMRGPAAGGQIGERWQL